MIGAVVNEIYRQEKIDRGTHREKQRDNLVVDSPKLQKTQKLVSTLFFVVSFSLEPIWKTQQWPQDWKRSVFVPIQKKGNPKNAQTTRQLHSSHTLVK